MRYEKTVAIVQARLAGTRLPGKVLMPIGTSSLLERVVERVLRMQRIDGLLVATTHAPHDDAIEHLCRSNGWACYRGADEDVLERLYRAAQSVQANHIVRIDGDQPFLDWREADRLVDMHLHEGADLSHNLSARGSGLPDGAGCEIVRFEALESAWREARDPAQRVHPCEFVFADPKRFRVLSRRAPPELARPGYRLRVESPDDLERARRIHRVLGERACVELSRAIALLDSDVLTRGVAM
ncbi:MAG: acylneuraminate cytidylyltransferase [Planctomycetes bacterium]|nr:acylneuraminate cytidylyltransferase [Planctomycetota bacterium]